jgi:hypothetical protein
VVNWRRPIFNAMGVCLTKSMSAVCLAFNHRRQDRWPRMNQQSHDLLYTRGELSRLTPRVTLFLLSSPSTFPLHSCHQTTPAFWLQSAVIRCVICAVETPELFRSLTIDAARE